MVSTRLGRANGEAGEIPHFNRRRPPGAYCVRRAAFVELPCLPDLPARRLPSSLRRPLTLRDGL